MKRRKFTFSPAGISLQKTDVKTTRVLTSRQSRRLHFKEFRQFIQKALHGSVLARTSAAACLAIALLPATAQQTCNTFKNADAANAITKLLRPGEEIKGLDFADIDADGDLDCYVKLYSPENYYYGFPFLFRNIGTATLPVFQRDDNSGFQNTTNNVFSYSDVQFADLDGDGDFDCFIAESYTYGGTTIHYFQNVGTPEVPVFVSNEAANPLGFAYSFYGIGFTIADIDGDGDLDVAVSPEFGFYGQTIYYNIGTATSPEFDNGHRDLSRVSDHRIYYDWNKDGLPDYFDDGAYYRNVGTVAHPAYVADSTGPQFQNGAPYRFVDLNKDSFTEVFTFGGNYSTLAPVAVINAKAGQRGGFAYTLLTSSNQSPDYTYQWKLNGIDIANATRPFYLATKKGKYTLTVTSTCGTGISLPYILKTNAGAQNSDAFVAGFNSLSSHASVFMKAFPNPFVHAITLQIAQPAGGSVIKVCDLQGRVLLTQQTNNATVFIGENLSRGVYMVQVWQANGLVFSQKVIKE